MQPVGFKEANIVYAKDHPKYLPLPAFKDEGIVTTCWSLTWWERWKLFRKGIVWIEIMPFDNPLQPIRPTVDSPFTHGVRP